MSLARWKRAGMAAAMATCLGLVAWASVVAWQRPCRQAGVSLFTRISGCPSLLEDSPLVIAFGLWLLGLLIWSAGRRNLPALLCALGGAIIATGKIGAIDDASGTRLFYWLLPWLAPLLFHFSSALLDRPLGRVSRGALLCLFVLAAAASLPFLLWTTDALRQQGIYGSLRTGIRLFVAVALLLSILLLLRGSRESASLAVRRRLRLVATGSILAIAPLLLLSLLPDTLNLPYYAPYEVTIPWLLLSPGSYAYSLLRRRTAALELRLDPLAVFYLLTVLLLSFYLAGAAFLDNVLGRDAGVYPVGRALLGLSLVYLFALLRSATTKFIHWSVWGDESPLADAVGSLSASLSTALDRRTLQRVLLHELPAALDAPRAALFVSGANHTLELLDVLDLGGDAVGVGESLDRGHLLAYLEAAGKPLVGDRVQTALVAAPLETAERALISMATAALWIPLIAGGTLRGLLLLWPRDPGAPFSPDAYRVLTTAAQQGGLAAHNVQLLEQARADAAELDRARRRLALAHEQERGELARALHDDVVQQLLGLSYQVAEVQHAAGGAIDGRAPNTVQGPLQDIRQSLQEVMAELRRLIGGLRPPGLDELGLHVAIETDAARLRSEAGPQTPQIETDLDPQARRLPEPAALCLYRVAQEGLRNALRHAQARRIVLRLHVLPNAVTLSVADDGIGFHVPEHLSEFAQHDHFGLIGLAERVSWVGGELHIQSQPGAGTEVTAHVPLPIGDIANARADPRADSR